MGDKDETKGTPSDESKGTPKDESKGTPKDKGKLYTDAEIDKIKANAAAMGQGREKKVAEQEKSALTQELQSTKSRLDALEREMDESRLAEAKGEPAQMPVYQREQAVKKRERQADDREGDLTRREGQVKADREEVDKDRGVVSIAYIAAKHGLETEELEELGISDHEQLEKVAAKLAAAKPKEPGEGEGEGEGEEEFTPDSGETAGGAGALAALEKANEDFQSGKITEKQLQEATSKVPDKVK